MSEEVKSCGAASASCACVLPAGHAGYHACTCGGAWLEKEDGTFQVLRWPYRVGAYTREELLAMNARQEGRA